MSRARDKANSTVSNFASTGIDDNADANAITIDASENVGIGNTTPSSFYSLASDLVVGTGSGGNGLTIYSGSSDSGYIGFNDTASASMQGFIQYNHNGDYMALAPNGSEKVRILSGGGLTFNGDTAAANALDDYEEGNWTPTIYYQNSDDQTNSSNVQQEGRYVKIGTAVVASCFLKFSATDARANDNIGVNGLPFVATQATGNGNFQQTAAVHLAGTSYPQGDAGVIAIVNPGSTLMQFVTTNNGGNLGDDFGQNTGMEVRFTLTYVTN